MTEKKLFVFVDNLLTDRKVPPLCKEAADSDLQALGWVRAEPTDCGKCKFFEVTKTAGLMKESSCYKKNMYQLHRGMDGFICLDFLLKESPQGKPKKPEGEKHD